MKNPRWFRATMVLALVLFVIGGTVALAVRRTRSQGPQQKPTQWAVWKPIKKSVDLFGPSVSVNLVNLPDKAEWIVGATPTKDGEKQEASVGVVHWVDSGASQRLKIQRIDSIQDYPEGLVEITADSLNVRGSEALVAADKTLIIHLKLHAGTQVHLDQDGSDMGTKVLSENGFGVKNGLPIAFPVTGPSVLLTYLATDRIMRVTGGDPKGVQIHAKN